MKLIFILLVGLVLFFLYHAVQVWLKINVSKKLVEKTVPFQLASNDFTKALLVLGDSTAVGVGADRPEHSVPALYAQFIDATYIENKAVSGSRITDAQEQLKKASQEQYSHILIQAGANDIVAYASVIEAEKQLRALLESLPKHENLTVLTCGNVGGASLIPWFARSLYTKKTLEYHQMYERVVPEFGGIYINLYIPKQHDPFLKEPEKYLAEDQFHPSSDGYALWFEKISERILK